jgi:hypothetical protein
MNRRAFLMRGAGLGLGAVAWACARGGDGNGDGANRTAAPASSGASALNVIAGAGAMAIGDTRLPIVVLRGQRPFAPKDLNVRLVPPGGEPFEVEAQHEEIVRGLGGVEHSDDHTHAPGTEVEDIFVVRHDFDRAGAWETLVDADGERGGAAFQVVADDPSPKVGDKAIASKSPTTDDPRGVDPICTRDPVCTMHDMTIAEALDASKPLVLIVATPRFCTSRACGPIVDLVEYEKGRIGDAASFIHVEVWKDDDEAVGSKPSPTFAEWKFGGEPWLYFIDAKGEVKDRWLGPAGAEELTRAVDNLI